MAIKSPDQNNFEDLNVRDLKNLNVFQYSFPVGEANKFKYVEWIYIIFVYIL